MLEQWWQCEDEVYETLKDTVNAIKSNQSSRIQDIAFLRRLYGAKPETLFGAAYVTDLEGESPPLPINVIAEVIDSYVATIVRSAPRIVAVSVGGDYEMRTKAEERTRFHDGVAYQTKLRRDRRKVGIETAVTGTGCLKGYHEHGELCHWVVPIEEIWIDELDGRDGNPRCLYQRHYVDRHQLMELFPGKRVLLEESSAGRPEDDRWPGYSTRADQVLVTEGWHLRSGPNADDGRHVIAVDNTTLIDSEWTWDRFPFAFCQFEPPMGGFWPTSITEKLYGPQCAINDLVEQVLANMRQFGKPRIFVERGSRVNPADFTDGLDAEIIEYNGKMPTIATVMAIPPDTYKAIELCRQAAYQRIGMPDVASSGQVPPGIESLPGIRAMSDMKTARHALDAEAWEEWHLDVADLDIHVARDLAREGDFSTIFVGRHYGRTEAKRIKYWEPSEGEEYVLRAYPSGKMPEDMPGKLALTGEMEARGMLTPDETMDLIDMPDIDRAIDSRTAGIKAIEANINAIMADKRYEPPEPFLPLQLALVKGRDAYNLAKVDGITDERMEMLRRWIDDVQALMSDAAATEPAPPPGPPGEPMPPEGTVMQ